MSELGEMNARLRALEKQVLSDTDVSKQESVSEMIIRANSMFTSSLSFRENVVKVLPRCEEISRCVEFEYQSVGDKQKIIRLLRPQIEKLATNARQFQSLRLDEIKPQGWDDRESRRLQHLMTDAVDCKSSSDEVTYQTHRLLNSYKQILENLQDNCRLMEEAVTELELGVVGRANRSQD